MRKAFTLIEVNLAMLIMAGGILSIIGLYAFGFRENRQSREDVAAAAYADAVMSPLVMAASATNLVWSKFKNLDSYPSSRGWGDYIDDQTGVVKEDPSSKAKTAFSSFVGSLQGMASKGTTLLVPAYPSESKFKINNSKNLHGALVITHQRGSAVVKISFRATDKAGTLMSKPLFFTEARFQGVVDE